MISEESVAAAMRKETRSIDQLAISHRVGRRKVKPILDDLLAAGVVELVAATKRGPRWGLVGVDYPDRAAIRGKSAPQHDELHQRFFAVI